MEFQFDQLLKDETIPARHRLGLLFIVKMIEKVFWGTLLAGFLFYKSWLLAVAFGMTVGFLLFGTLCIVVQELIKDPAISTTAPVGFWANFVNDVSMKALWLVVAIAVAFMWKLMPDMQGLGAGEIVNAIVDTTINKPSAPSP